MIDEPVATVGDRLPHGVVAGASLDQAVALRRDTAECEVCRDHLPRRGSVRDVEIGTAVGLDLIAGERVDNRELGVRAVASDLTGDADRAHPEQGADLEHLRRRLRHDRERSQLGDDVSRGAGEATDASQLELDQCAVGEMQRDGHPVRVVDPLELPDQLVEVGLGHQARHVPTRRPEQHVDAESERVDGNGQVPGATLQHRQGRLTLGVKLRHLIERGSGRREILEDGGEALLVGSRLGTAAVEFGPNVAKGADVVLELPAQLGPHPVCLTPCDTGHG